MASTIITARERQLSSRLANYAEVTARPKLSEVKLLFERLAISLRKAYLVDLCCNFRVIPALQNRFWELG